MACASFVTQSLLRKRSSDYQLVAALHGELASASFTYLEYVTQHGLEGKVVLFNLKSNLKRRELSCVGAGGKADLQVFEKYRLSEEEESGVSV